MNTIEKQVLIEQSGDPKKCLEIIDTALQLLRDENIKMSDSQWLSLISHLSGMVYRSIHQEKLNPINKELFREVSKDSIRLAEKVCKLLPNLTDDEKYLLSIHFESAKLNN